MKVPFISILLLFFTLLSCDFKKSKSNDEIVYKNGELTINLDNKRFENLENIRIVSKNKVNNSLKIKSGKIDLIENVIQLSNKKDYVNTWIKIDKQGNIDFSSSYFYETFLSTEKSMVFVNCDLDYVLLPEGKHFVLIGHFDDDFNLSNTEIDTVYFDKRNLIAKIPFPDWKVGNNQIRFIIVEEVFHKGILKRKMTYCDKEFFIKP
jgi:hypothetical protein